MRDIIRYPAKFYLASFALHTLVLSMSLIGFVVLLNSNKTLLSVFYAFIFAISVIGFVFTLYELQWVIIDSTHISAYNIFGLVKRIEISKINTVSYTNARAWGIKMYAKRYPCIVISHLKSLSISGIDNAFNAKKLPYIILPDTEDNQQILKKCQILK